MRRVTRQSFTRDAQGRPLLSESERIVDNGNGETHVTTDRQVRTCAGCQRPVADLSELRGRCDWCGTRSVCTHCISQCQICSRRLCGQCRRGFAGKSPMTVCDACRGRLVARQAIEDRLQLQRLGRERELALLRERHQLQADQLAQQRFEFEAKMQMARLRLDAGLPLEPQSLPRRILFGTLRYVARLCQLPINPSR